MAALLSFVVCLALSGGLGYLAYQRFRSRDRRGATRLTALALVPLGLDLAGFVRLGRKIADAVGHWALHLVFDPLVWIGIVMLGLAALLWIATGFGAAAPGAPEGAAPGTKRAVGPSRQKPTADEDPEIEAILRRHGVS
ncbi:MAG: hypothetical protein QOE76_1618 [Frankiales bacterium]|jgi:hypothetical protein|nr:hypothetical protein [Frankiales bacterium]MDX6243895.1 hypothetical protein [Frankiales bacterium]